MKMSEGLLSEKEIKQLYKIIERVLYSPYNKYYVN